MFTHEALEALRQLNALARQSRRLAPGVGRLKELRARIEQVRGTVPEPVLRFHDRMEKQGRESVVRLHGSCCSGCHLRLPYAELSALHQPDHYVPCPNCSSFVWSGSVLENEPMLAKTAVLAAS